MNDDFNLSSYDFELPEELIAQYPAPQRDHSRLMVMEQGDKITHTRFPAILDLLNPGDLLVRNNTKVFPARLLGTKESGGRVEILLLEYPGNTKGQREENDWTFTDCQVLLKSSKRPKPGSILKFSPDMEAVVKKLHPDGKVEIKLRYKTVNGKTFDDILAKCGQIPLPPYIHRPEGTTPDDTVRYQTCYAQNTGSVAAPTAGLHFTKELDNAIKAKGVDCCHLTLHVGYGTFATVRVDNIKKHQIHEESVEIKPETAAQINAVKTAGGRIWAVGTTTVRTLEFAADDSGIVKPLSGPCDLFIYPGHRFKIVDNLITNFHLPRSSLLFLVSAMVGRKSLLSGYQQAIKRGYRFFSYGDAMTCRVSEGR
jgi:S-adenosylmethionine:tRNA ribosyltransferase-isomerase